MWDIRTLDLGEVELNESRLVVAARPGMLVRVPVQGWLLVGPQFNVVIDTGFRFPDILKRLGDRAQGIATRAQRIAPQLALHGLQPADVRYVLHTHLHIDHAGETDVFPMTTTAVVNRRELEYAVSGLSGPSYPPEDIKHIIDRLHTPGALRLLDLELTGGEEVLDGIRCVAAGGHTEGSMVITVDTADGPAVFCGDLVYSVRHQLQTPRILDFDPGISANIVVSRRHEKAAMKRLLATAPRFKLFPSHDQPAVIDRGHVVSAGSGEGAGPDGCWCRMTSMGYREHESHRA
ncbi:MAG: N-acyl homoserine lactonase family protein [Polaromonas sp.]|nr:N-acyl homoserine lactonase family protein [Polaromonas sp.]